ncbi:MAG: hypothetical protein WDZ52_03620 [Pseudohongiellaceae bacterium]
MKGLKTALRQVPNHIRISLLYLVFASVYIVVSGLLLNSFSDYPQQLFGIEILNGLAFVIVTTFILQYILRRERSKRALDQLPFTQLLENVDYAVVMLDLKKLNLVYANPMFRKTFVNGDLLMAICKSKNFRLITYSMRRFQCQH